MTLKENITENNFLRYPLRYGLGFFNTGIANVRILIQRREILPNFTDVNWISVTDFPTAIWELLQRVSVAAR